MYSWEITKTMELYNYSLPSNVYLEMTKNSPQINHITYRAGDNRFDMWDQEGEYWSFDVYYAAA